MTENMVRTAFMVSPRVKERVKKAAEENGMQQAEIFRLGVIKALNELEGDTNEKK